MRSIKIVVASLFVWSIVPGAAMAYVGPGAGITLIGSLVAVIFAVLLAIVGFVWYPIRRLRARRKKQGEVREELRQEVKGRTNQEVGQ